VGIALQSPHLIEGLTALENVMLPLVPVARSAAEKIMAEFPGSN